MSDTANGSILAAGVDGCRGGWLAALARGERSAPRTEMRLVLTLAELVDALDETTVIAIDVPIGLPQLTGSRPCDAQARSRLTHREPIYRRTSSVFNPPDRELIATTTFAEVQAIVAARRLRFGSTRGLSVQAFGIREKVSEADRLVRSRPDLEARLVEVHPEVSFRAMAGALEAKRRPGGATARRDALRREFPDIDAVIAADRLPRSTVARDDILDAYAGLWSALRFSDGRHETLGGGRDHLGVPMRMVV